MEDRKPSSSRGADKRSHEESTGEPRRGGRREEVRRGGKWSQTALKKQRTGEREERKREER